MTDIFEMLTSYFYDVFVANFDGWVVLGFVAQGFFTMRFVVQWIASERARKSVIPVAFWFFSIGGGIFFWFTPFTGEIRCSSPAKLSVSLFIFATCTSSFSMDANHQREKQQKARGRSLGHCRALKAANPRSRSALRSSKFSRPMCSRSVGPPGVQFVAVRYEAQS